MNIIKQKLQISYYYELYIIRCHTWQLFDSKFPFLKEELH